MTGSVATGWTLDHVTLSGATFCDGSGQVQLGSIQDDDDGTYSFTTRDASGAPLSADIVCRWGPSLGGDEVTVSAAVTFLDPYPGWGRRRKLTFDNSGLGEQIDFPVPMRLDVDGFDYQNTYGRKDLRFVGADLATVLDHEVENWNDQGSSVVWVRIPRIAAGSDRDHVWMYYD
jgi:hypothetical protein